MRPSRAADLITATITLTNVPAGLPTNITINASTRVWTNNASGAPGTSIQITNTVANSTTNLLNQLTDYPVDTGWYLSQTSPTNVLIRARVGQALTVTFNPSPGWAFVTYSTQTVSSPTWNVRVPITVEANTNRTNIASLLTTAISDYSTNALATNSTAGSNFLTKGASPVQAIASPVQLNGRVGIGGSLNATNGFTSSLTNINPVLSNAVNFGSAFRSEGPGGNSFQAGSNATAAGNFDFVAGNSAMASNGYNTVVGILAKSTNGIGSAFGQNANANFAGSSFGANSSAGTNAAAFGQGAGASGYRSFAGGDSATVSGERGIGLGFAPQVTALDGMGFGFGAAASAMSTIAFGPATVASHSNSVAFGPPDHLGNAVATTTTNQIVMGTLSHRVYVPGILSVVQYSNVTTMPGTTNLARGSWSYPRFDLSTLAAGNNISVPFGTNLYIRCNSGPASAATICGIIGGATSGGLDGQLVEVFNDTGFGLTFAVNTVDPIAANRINTPLGTDVTIADQASARLLYDGTDSRWKLISPFSVTASATNALATLTTNGVLVSSAWTNCNLIYGPGIAARTTNTAGKVDIQISTDLHLFTITNDVVITNVTGPVSVLSNLLGSATLAADFWQPGKAIEIDLFGKYFMTGTVTQSNEVYYGSALLATNSMPYFAAAGDDWQSHVTIVCRSIGASGSLYCQGFTELPSSVGGVSGVTKNVRLVSGAVTVNTTISTLLDYKFNPGATTTALYIHAGTAKVIP